MDENELVKNYPLSLLTITLYIISQVSAILTGKYTTYKVHYKVVAYQAY